MEFLIRNTGAGLLLLTLTLPASGRISGCDPALLEAQLRQGEVALAEGRLGQARILIESAIQDEDGCESSPSRELYIVGLAGLAVVERISKNPQKGLNWADQALELAEQHFPNHEEYLADALESHAQLLSEVGRYYEAEPEVRRAIGILETLTPPRNVELASCYNTLSVLHLRLSDTEGAHRQLERAMAHVSAIAQSEEKRAPLTAVYHNLAMTAWLEGNPEQGLQDVDRALELAQKTIPPGHPYLAAVLQTKVKLLKALNRKGELRKLQERIREIAAKSRE